MTAGVGPILERPAVRLASRSQSQSPQPLRPDTLREPEDRAFDVATINRRLQHMAEQVEQAPPRARLRR